MKYHSDEIERRAIEAAGKVLDAYLRRRKYMVRQSPIGRTKRWLKPNFDPQSGERDWRKKP